jgi:PilZ domain-containing protein
MARRREDRVQVALPVRVWGMTLDGKPFNEQLTTCDVSRFGARIAFRNCSLKLGDIVGVQYKTEKARFRVVWIAANKSEFGISGAEPGKSIWGTLPHGPAHPVRAAAPAAAAAPAPAPVAKERRQHKRFPCKGGAQLRRGDNPPIWATLADISAGGCYVETSSPLVMGTEYEVTLKVANSELRCRCQARTCHPGIGAGLQFTFVTPETRKQINQILDVLAGVAIGDDISTLDSKTDISGRVYKSTEEVRAIETLLQSDSADVDPRILSEFRNAVDHARQTAWAVQTWIEMRKQRRDPFSLMPIVEKRRMGQAVFLLKELLMDYQSGVLSVDTEGFPDLRNAVKDFQRTIEKQ